MISILRPNLADITSSELDDSVGAKFLANVNVLRYVCYMLSAVRLSSVCDVGALYSGG